MESNLTTQEKSLLEGLLFLYNLTEENNVLDQALPAFLKDSGCNNVHRCARYLVDNNYIERSRAGMVGNTKCTWKCKVRPNIVMIRAILEGVRKAAKLEKKPKTKSREQFSRVITKPKASNSDQLIEQLESDIMVMERLLKEKKTALKVLKQMI